MCRCMLGFAGLDINSSSGKCRRKATASEAAPCGVAGEARMGFKSRVSFQHSERHRHLINEPMIGGRKANANEYPTEYRPLVDVNFSGGPLHLAFSFQPQDTLLKIKLSKRGVFTAIPFVSPMSLSVYNS